MARQRPDISDDGYCRKCGAKVRKAGKYPDGTQRWRGHKGCGTVPESGTVPDEEWLDDNELAKFYASVVRDRNRYIETRLKAAKQAKDEGLVKSKVEDDQAKRMDPITIVPDSEVLTDGGS